MDGFLLGFKFGALLGESLRKVDGIMVERAVGFEVGAEFGLILGTSLPGI